MTQKLSFVSRAVCRFYLNLLNKHALDVAKIIDDQPNTNPAGVYLLDGDWSRFVKLESPKKLNIDYYRQQFSGKMLCLEFRKESLVNDLLDLDNVEIHVIPLYQYQLRMAKFEIGRKRHCLSSDEPATDVLLLVWLPEWIQRLM